jgi:hypothetical protein
MHEVSTPCTGDAASPRPELTAPLAHAYARFEEALELLGCAPMGDPVDLSSDDMQAMASRHMVRCLAEAAVERLIAFLDEIDGDPDLEPSLGFHLPGEVLDGEPYFADCDEARDEREDDADREPSLGWTAAIDQAGIGWTGGGDDLEQG